jgi:hypothetical protein
VQEPKLHNDQEPQEECGSVGAAEVLFDVPQAHIAQGSEVGDRPFALGGLPPTGARIERLGQEKETDAD